MEATIKKKINKKGDVEFLYYVNGRLVRTSKRLYIASTINGEIFWGRTDLVGRGNTYKRYQDAIKINENITIDDIRKKHQKEVNHYIKVLAEYQSEKHLQWHKDLMTRFGGKLNEEEAQRSWRVDIESAKEWLKSAEDRNNELAIQQDYAQRKEYARRKKEEMTIVYYKILK